MSSKPIHIRPAGFTHVLCVYVGRSANPEASDKEHATQLGRLGAACEECRVASDRMQEEGDLFLDGEGIWQFNEIPEEFRSVYSFIQYLQEEERTTFYVEELQELVHHTKEKYRETLEFLKSKNFRVQPKEKEKNVRGINSFWKSGVPPV